MRLVSVLLASIAFAANAQQPDWLASRPVSYSMNPGLPRHVLASSPSGNLMSAHLTHGAFGFGQDIFGPCTIERLDPANGQPFWTCSLTDSVTVETGAVDAEGNVYVAGQFMGGLSVCDGSTLAHTGSVWDVDLYIMKFDPDGTLLWARNISVTDGQASMITAMAIDPNGDAWYATSDFFLVRLAKVDDLGNDVEVRYIDGAKTIGGMAFSPSGALYVSGACDDFGFAFGGLVATPPVGGSYFMFLLRYDAQGQGDWAEFAHDITFQFPDVAVDDEGNAYVACNAFDPTDWGGIAINGADWVSSTFLVKADSTGNFLWGVESDAPGGNINGDLEAAARNTVAVDGDGNAYLTGTLRGQVDWGNGVVSDGLTLGARSQTIVAFDTNGIPQWETTSMPLGFLNAMAVTAMQDGTVHFSAHVNGPLSFPPLIANDGGLQAFTVGRINGLSTDVPSIVAEPVISAWPVPANAADDPFNKHTAPGRICSRSRDRPLRIPICRVSLRSTSRRSMPGSICSAYRTEARSAW
ncbi:MAG: hypothetical protein IPG92_03820 [Flavobacteriales bacterium]|nr:hypothetical protein [Flavobacteriales bacterium]